ncbi:NUDIX domain-containing protein [Sediminitomix flava]|uniref:ADP-ribose pyrophosphatase n=1 Tax=Sediminitomix flava TaxID=379075 RepID=A0A315ZFS9_SEDFL|nr:NUDIX domain-containing protein [Sediminitomix flava]PWJ44435.1 ADP-ribose pyrophosphatase [Sediminitomix flava]
MYLKGKKINKHPQKVEILSEETVYDDFLKIRKGTLRHEKFDGGMTDTITRIFNDRGEAVTAILWHKDLQKVVLVRQFRFPIMQSGNAWLTETVAGILDKGESKFEAIEREVLEETGYKAQKTEFICSFFSTPGNTYEKVHLFYIEVDNASKIEEGGGLDCEYEDIALEFYDKKTLYKMLEEGQIHDAKTIIGLQWLQTQDLISQNIPKI